MTKLCQRHTELPPLPGDVANLWLANCIRQRNFLSGKLGGLDAELLGGVPPENGS